MPTPQFEAFEAVGEQAPIADEVEPLPFRRLNPNEVDEETPGGIYAVATEDECVYQLHQLTPPCAETKAADRLRGLPYLLKEGGIHWEGVKDKGPDALRTFGIEVERITRNAESGNRHDYSPDGRTVHFPDGTNMDAVEAGHTVESTKSVTESSNERPFLGLGNLRDGGKGEILEKKLWLAAQGIATPGISTVPEAVTKEDVTDDPYIRQFLINDEHTKLFLEFVSSAGIHLNIEAVSPNQGLFAINAVQSLSPVLNVLTEASPYRDGKVDQTINGHFELLNEIIGTDHSAKVKNDVRKVVRAMSDLKIGPDWRQISRILGSESGGPLKMEAPADIESFLAEADRQLSVGETFSGSRTLGWHTDRYCLDKGDGVVELCNLSRAGDNPHKTSAVIDLAAKAVLALQHYHANPREFKDEWEGVIPRPEDRDFARERQKTIDVSRINYSVTALYGKDRDIFDTRAVVGFDQETGQSIIDPNGPTRNLKDVLKIYFDFIEIYMPDRPISEDTRDELLATLSDLPEDISFSSPDEVFSYFYTPGSELTAAEAIRLAHQLDQDGLSYQQMLIKFEEHCIEAWKDKDEELSLAA